MREKVLSSVGGVSKMGEFDWFMVTVSLLMGYPNRTQSLVHQLLDGKQLSKQCRP